MSASNLYLTAYNAASLCLWGYVLYATIEDIRSYWNGSATTIEGFQHNFVKWLGSEVPHSFLVKTQVFNSTAEIGHSMVRLVHTPIATILLQSLARLLIVVGVCCKLPESPGNYHFWAFAGIMLAWSVTEVVRYGFYVLKLTGIRTRYWMTWLRYSTFIVMYPLGLLCESTVVYLSLSVATGGYYYFLVFALAMYLPGFVTLYSYMFRQRRKAMAVT